MVKTKITLEQFLELLKRKQGNRTQRALAEELDVSAAYLNDVYQGNRMPGDALAESMGFKRVMYFETITRRRNGN